MRMEFTLDAARRDGELERAFAREVAERFGMEWRLATRRRAKRVAVLVSREDHCLLDLLWRWRRGELGARDPARRSPTTPTARRDVEALRRPVRARAGRRRATKPAAEARHARAARRAASTWSCSRATCRSSAATSSTGVGVPGDQHPPLVPAGVRRRRPLPPGARARREDHRRDRPLRDRGARRGADHRAGRRARLPPRRRRRPRRASGATSSARCSRARSRCTRGPRARRTATRRSCSRPLRAPAHGGAAYRHDVAPPLAADVILDRVRAIPPGFVRTYGDLCPAAPRRAGAALAGCADPGVPWHRVVRADGSLAKGARQRALLDEEGVPLPRRPRRPARGTMRARCGCSVRSRLEPRPRGFHLVTARGRARAARARRARGRPLPPLPPPHVGVADPQRERLARRAARLRARGSTTPCPRASPLGAHARGAPTTCPPTSRPRCSGRRCSLPVARGRLALGTWQGVYALRAPRPRRGTLAAGHRVGSVAPREP